MEMMDGICSEGLFGWLRKHFLSTSIMRVVADVLVSVT